MTKQWVKIRLSPSRELTVHTEELDCSKLVGVLFPDPPEEWCDILKGLALKDPGEFTTDLLREGDQPYCLFDVATVPWGKLGKTHVVLTVLALTDRIVKTFQELASLVDATNTEFGERYKETIQANEMIHTAMNELEGKGWAVE